MLLARRIVERDQAPYGRERYLILPNPLKQYQQGAQAYFYYEIYNLQKDRFGATNYQVTYQIRTVKEDAAAASRNGPRRFPIPTRDRRHGSRFTRC